MSEDALEVQRRELDALEMELQTTGSHAMDIGARNRTMVLYKSILFFLNTELSLQAKLLFLTLLDDGPSDSRALTLFCVRESPRNGYVTI